MRRLDDRGKAIALLALFLVVAVVISVFSLRPYVGGHPFIGHADQANTANLGQNIAAGRGAVVDTVWLHTAGGLPGNAVTHPEPYWSVSVAWIVAAFFLLLEPGRLALALPALLALLATTGLVGTWAWIATRRFWPTAMVIAGTGFSPILLKGVGGLSDNYLVAATVACTTALVRGLTTGHRAWLLASGLLFGIAVTFKPSAILLLGLWPFYAILARRWRLHREIGIFLLGAVLPLAVYAHYNHSAYGTLMPGGTELVLMAADIKHELAKKEGVAPIEAHNRAFYDPALDASRLAIDTRERIEIAADRFLDFIDKGMRRAWLMPWWYQLLAVIGTAMVVWRWWTRPEGVAPTAAELYPAFSVALLIAGLVLAATVHFEARYWAFMPPVALVLGATVLRTWAGSVVAALVAFLAIEEGGLWLRDLEWRQTPTAYARVAEMLPPGTVVYSANPWQFAFHTRLPAVMTPYTGDLDVVRATARRYGVAYLVTIDHDSRYPAFQERPPGEWPDIYEPVFDDGQLGIWRIVGE